METVGQVGILIPIFLWHKKRLNSPMFYISEYFEEFREEYTGNLLNISRNNDWQNWISFFLDAVTNQAKQNAEKASQILALYNDMKNRVPVIANSQYGIKVIDTLFSKPIFRLTDFVKNVRINTSNKL